MDHKIVSREEWLAARKAHRKNEKGLTHLRDLVAAERRALPWVKVEKPFRNPGRQKDSRRPFRRSPPCRSSQETLIENPPSSSLQEFRNDPSMP
jgi:hypothetical protein